jgi:hypothetical protein
VSIEADGMITKVPVPVAVLVTERSDCPFHNTRCTFHHMNTALLSELFGRAGRYRALRCL